MRRSLGLAMLLLAGCESQQQRDDKERLALETEVRAMLDDQSTDPNATQLRNVRLAPTTKNAICGEANIKNEQGAFKGFKPFLAFRDSDKTPLFSEVGAIVTVENDRAINECGSKLQKVNFAQDMKIVEDRFASEIDRKQREADIAVMEAQLRLKQAQAD